jgi:UDP-GlcNAc:undecaprenyl-phosphate GlcNAc-1-phosphate transferase
MQYLIISFTTLVVTILVTPYFTDILNRVKIVDQPDGKRKIHTSPVPRMGGVLIFAVLITALFIFYADFSTIKIFLFGTIIIFILGVYDDLMGAGWLVKFVYQIVSASLLIVFLLPRFSSVSLFGIEFSIIPSLVILLIFIVGTINSFNLLDGLDGLVSGISLMILTLMFLISLEISDTFLLILLASVIGIVIGFMKYNTFPARIFLGDSGSYLLGYIVLSVVLSTSVNLFTGVMDLTFVVILLAVPIADTLKVLARRLFAGRHPFEPDRTHIHHIVSSKNVTHQTTVFIISVYSLLFTIAAIIYRFYTIPAGIILFLLLLVPLIFANKILDFILKHEKLLQIGRRLNRFPQLLINYYKGGVVPAAGIFVILYLVFLFINEINIRVEFLLPSLFIVGFLLIFTFLNYRKNKLLTDIIVFFNVLIFFIINQTGTILYKNITVLPVFGNLNYHLLIVSILLPIVIFFLFFRDRIIPEQKTFLTGFDLAIIIIIIMLSITSNMLPFSKSFLITDTIFRSFLIYAFYKVIISLKPKFRISLYILSFLIVVSSQLALIIL